MIENTRVYYNDRCIYFTQDVENFLQQENIDHAWIINKDNPMQDFRDYFEQFLLSEMDHLIINVNGENGIEALKSIFKLVRAGGGVVTNSSNEYLLIYRLGHWDLPKGKCEKNEDIGDCALREVIEETGLVDVHLLDEMDKTYHIYIHNSDYVIKETVWYYMSSTDKDLVAQADEGIEKAL